VYKVLGAFDPDGGPITMTYYPFSDLSQYVILDGKTDTFMFRPTLYSQLGTQLITVSIADVNGASVS
jgi:hypothetical protein